MNTLMCCLERAREREREREKEKSKAFFHSVCTNNARFSLFKFSSGTVKPLFPF